MIKPADLHKLWSRPDNSRLTSKQFSFRLPVHVAAKIAALCEMYPTRSRTEIVGDLLSAALDDAIAALPSYAGAPLGEHPDTREPIFEEAGPIAEFRRIANRHFEALERELGNDNPGTLYNPTGYAVTGDDSKV